ncbi:MAG TPA: class I SAM-dependent methyltransferase [Pyrinomonadaceae bacterium]|nr:class I SAM-dependent methyltransferase [Pyrinomonadaceae bacterium]
MPKYSYEQSVSVLRSKAEHDIGIELCYLDLDNSIAAKRFAASEEFLAVIRMVPLLTRKQYLTVCDVGCGNGIAAYAFASLGHKVWAIDPDDSGDTGLRATARLAPLVTHGSITAVQALAESLPLISSACDIVYTRQAVHHFSNLAEGAKECARILKPGGYLFSTREHVITDEQQLEVFLRDHPLHQMHGGEHAYSLDTYKEAFAQAGLILSGCFGHYETVINHFPSTNREVKQLFFLALERRLGKSVAKLLTAVPTLESIYRKRLSDACDYPGRFYSFLYRKATQE